MQQTLLTLFAVVAAGLLMQQAMKANRADQASSFESETQVQARGVAVSILERLSGYPFDGGEGTTPGATGTNAFSPAASFGVGLPAVSLDALFASSAYDDIDDFDGLAGVSAAQAVTDPVTGATQSFEVSVNVSVDYVKHTPSTGWGSVNGATRTPHKQVTVTVDHETLTTPVRFGRVYSAPAD